MKQEEYGGGEEKVFFGGESLVKKPTKTKRPNRRYAEAIIEEPVESGPDESSYAPQNGSHAARATPSREIRKQERCRITKECGENAAGGGDESTGSGDQRERGERHRGLQLQCERAGGREDGWEEGEGMKQGAKGGGEGSSFIREEGLNNKQAKTNRPNRRYGEAIIEEPVENGPLPGGAVINKQKTNKNTKKKEGKENKQTSRSDVAI